LAGRRRPDIEEVPWSLAAPEMTFFQVAEEVTTANPSVFVAGKEIASVHFETLTICLSLPYLG
jgi:hypothetical protein